MPTDAEVIADLRKQLEEAKALHQPSTSQSPPSPMAVQSNNGNNHNGSERTLTKCKLTFDATDPSKITLFLQQVEDYRRAENISEEASLRSIACLLHGNALKWWHVDYLKVNTWQEFKQAIRTEFQPWTYDYQVLDDIRSRKQKHNEPLLEFFIHIQEMYDRMQNPPPELEQVQRLLGNLHPSYQPHIRRKDIRSYVDLKEQGKEAEAILKDIQRYHQPDGHQVKKPSSTHSSKGSQQHSKDSTEPSKDSKQKPASKERTTSKRPVKKCDYCHYRGHTMDVTST